MSTRSRIAVENPDGTVTSIYCHLDGYLEGVGQTLATKWHDPKQIAKLIALGDISTLGEKIGVRHSFAWRQEFYDKFKGAAPSEMRADPEFQRLDAMTLAYRRDRGEKGTGALLHAGEADYLATDTGTEYWYLYRDGTWFVSQGEGWANVIWELHLLPA